MPGFPLIMMGRTKYFSWGVTNFIIDSSDLFVENIVEDKYYMVDGKKLKLDIKSELI